VVDQYAGCNVVRYANPKRATYDYFLHCNKWWPLQVAFLLFLMKSG
jgi:hypothetical protein